MIVPLLLVFAAVCAFLLVQGMLRRGGIYQYPFLAGAVFTGWVLPQFIGLSHNQFLPSGALEATLIMASLSAAMCWFGTVAAGPVPSISFWIYDDKRLLVSSAVLTFLGAYFYYAISRLPPELLSSTWTGLPVAYWFFARMLEYGFSIAVLLFARNRSRLALVLAAFCASFYFDRIVISGRRADLIEICTIVLMAWWFQRNRCIPRPVMLVGLILGALFVNSAGDYRAATLSERGPQWDQVYDIDFFGNIEKLTQEGGPELTNAVYWVGAANRSMEFDLGAFHWNQLVFAYVPKQIVGADLKNALYLPTPNLAYEQFFYLSPGGATATGLGDAFQSFWYFGSLEFFLIAFIMQRLWLAARAGSITAQLIYMFMPSQAMQAITHETSYFVTPWVHMSIFLLPALMAARRREPQRRLVTDQVPD